MESVRAQAAADVEAVQAEATGEIEAALAEQESALAEEEERVNELTAELKAVRADLLAEQERADRLDGELADTTRDLTAVERRADQAEESADALRAKYDQEIHADALVAWDAEVASACQDAANGSSTISRYVDHTDELAVIGTEAELLELVTACAEPLRNRSEEEKLSSECETGSVDAITKDPDGLAGTCYVMYVIPWQWDSRTGPCNFLGGWDGSNLGTRRFNYDGDGLFRAPPDVCDEDLAGADQDDLIKIWATLEGPYRYDTAAGGTNEIPDFLIRKAVLVSKA